MEESLHLSIFTYKSNLEWLGLTCKHYKDHVSRTVGLIQVPAWVIDYLDQSMFN